MTSKTYSIRDLQGVAAVQARTLRHWIRQKVLPKPLGRGRGARYTEDHVLRVKVIRHLRTQRIRLAAIRSGSGTARAAARRASGAWPAPGPPPTSRRRISGLDFQQLQALLPRPRPGSIPEAVPPPPRAPSYPAVSCEVVALFDGLVLMINPAKGPVVRRIADEIYQHYGSRPA